HRRAEPGRADRQQGPDRATRGRRAGRPGRHRCPGRPCGRADSQRHQAREYPRRPVHRARQGWGFRAGAARDRDSGALAGGALARHAGLHKSRTGPRRVPARISTAWARHSTNVSPANPRFTASHRIVHQVINDEPSPPRALIPAIPADLETICLKAMAKDPSRRYATSAALASDLHRFLNGEPILARPVGPLERVWRWCRNNQRVAVLIALVTLLLLALTVGSILAAVSIYRERSVAIASARRADTQRGLAV